MGLLDYFSEDSIRKRRLKKLEKYLSKLGYDSLEINWEVHKVQPLHQGKSIRVTKVVLVD